VSMLVSLGALQGFLAISSCCSCACFFNVHLHKGRIADPI
jgi:hypothetical protein